MNDIEKTLSALKRKNFKAVYAKNAEDAKNYVLSVIGQNDTVGSGGSVTLVETGILDALLERGNQVYSGMLADRLGQDEDDVKRNGMTADVYLTSTNAITVAGDLINIDGTGNRVAAMIYGPPKVIIVAGKNKITANPNAAVARIKKIACPQNARRLGYHTPCAKTDRCEDCNHADRMCNVTVHIQYPTRGKEIHVILIDGDFGY
ncbi:MAG: lactate utilization protein [Christensenellales bacterium]|jgi:hypothetical protein